MPGSSQARDDEQRAALQAILGELPVNHPARRAYDAGADVIQLSQLVGREDLIDRLDQAWADWYARRVLLQRKASRAQ